VAITRLGDRIRVGGTAKISGYSDKLYDARRATLNHSLTDLFPRGGDTARATFWCGLRPMTPDGPPVIGATHAATSISTPAMARSAGQWPAAREGAGRPLSGRKPTL
jgi:glycine/D-amino acid oxidase-like deaminating enzyme